MLKHQDSLDVGLGLALYRWLSDYALRLAVLTNPCEALSVLWGHWDKMPMLMAGKRP